MEKKKHPFHYLALAIWRDMYISDLKLRKIVKDYVRKQMVQVN